MRGRLVGSSVYVGLCGVLTLAGIVVAVVMASDPDAPLFVGLGLGLGAMCALCGLLGVPSLWSALEWQRLAREWQADPRAARPTSTWEVVVRGTRAGEPDEVLRDGLPVLRVARAGNVDHGACRLEAGDRSLRLRPDRHDLTVLDGDVPVGSVEQRGGLLGAYLVLRVGDAALLPTGVMQRPVWGAVDRTGADRTLLFGPLPAHDGDGRTTALTAELPDDGDPAAWAALLWFLVWRRADYIATNQRIGESAGSFA
ncbi:hypothetical protein [Actinomycetospora sp. CA-084318]|uniref:hypothetical protein n=1 Tax=Actinomycetospora sp. CA-084318 TaxID=3239892 RepID=UPI003D972882